MKNPSGFHFISIDSVPRSIAISARFRRGCRARLMAKYPHSAVT